MKKLLFTMMIASLLFGMGCDSGTSRLVKVTVHSVQKARTEGSGISTTWFRSGCIYQLESGERVFSPNVYGEVGETFLIDERRLRQGL